VGLVNIFDHFLSNYRIANNLGRALMHTIRHKCQKTKNVFYILKDINIML